MKKIFLNLFLVASLSGYASNSEVSMKSGTHFSDTTVLPYILALPLSSFFGLPVDSLLAALPKSYTDRGFMPIGIGYARGVSQGYGTAVLNSCFVEIFIDNFQYLTFPNRSKTSTWNFDLAKQEIIGFIKVWKNNSCVYGCNNPKYY